MLTYHPTTEEEKYAIGTWKYPGEYALYDSEPYAEAKRKGFGFANPANHFYSFYDGETLVGFINLTLYEGESEVFFGIGVHPEHCGCGYGKQMTSAARQIAAQQFPGKRLYLEVRTWNTRAVRCYERAGFHIAGAPFHRTTALGDGEFYRMIAEPAGGA